MDRQLRRRRQIHLAVIRPAGAYSAIGHSRRRRDVSERLRIGRAHARAVAAVAAGAGRRCVGLEAARGHGGVAAVAAGAGVCWTAGGGRGSLGGVVTGGFQAGESHAPGVVVMHVHFDAHGVAALWLAAVGWHG
jgi:hypothetical protein